MASSTVNSNAKVPGDALAAFGLAGAELLPKTLDTGRMFIAELDGLNVVESDESLGAHQRGIEEKITHYAFVGVKTIDEDKIQRLAPKRFHDDIAGAQYV